MHKLYRFDQRARNNWHPYLPFMDNFILLSYLPKVQSLTQLLNSQGVKIRFLFLHEDRTLLGWQEKAAGWSASSLTQFSFPLHHFPTWKWPVKNSFKRRMLVCPLYQKCFPNFCSIRPCSPFVTSMEQHPWHVYFAVFSDRIWASSTSHSQISSSAAFLMLSRSLISGLACPFLITLQNRAASFRW